VEQVPGSRFKVPGSRFKVQSSRFQVQGFRFKVSGSKFKVPGFRFQVPGLGLMEFILHLNENAKHFSFRCSYAAGFLVIFFVFEVQAVWSL